MGNESPKWHWRTRYLDLFSGSGAYAVNRGVADDDLFHKEETPEEQQELQEGSAQIALSIKPRFSRIDLVEKNPEFASSLEKLAGDELNSRVFVHCEDANSATRKLMSTARRNDRILAFVDPYGCEVEWTTLEALADSRIADVWYLFPTMGAIRQLPSSQDSITKDKEATLDRLLGTREWRDTFYESKVEVDLFGESDRTTRRAGPNIVEKFFLSRLKSVFPFVYDDCLRLRYSKNGHLFSLCFAMGNPSESAISAGRRLAKAAIDRWEKSR